MTQGQMSEISDKTFACPRCGNRFAWKPSLAGKKLSCSCGRIIDVDAGEGEVREAPRATSKVGTAIEGRAALYPKRMVSAVAEQEEEARFSLVKDRVLPIVLIVLGIGGRAAQAIYVSSRTHHPVVGAAMVGFDLISGVAVTLLGGYFAAALLAVNFGHLGTAAIKLTAIAIFAGAAAAWVPYLDYDPTRIRGMLLALQLALLIYFPLFYAMFEIDLQEALTTTLLVGVMQGLVVVGMHAAN